MAIVRRLNAAERRYLHWFHWFALVSLVCIGCIGFSGFIGFIGCIGLHWFRVHPIEISYDYTEILDVY